MTEVNWKRRLLNWSIGGALFIGIVSGLRRCQLEHRPFARVDDWYTAAPSDVDDWTALGEKQVHPVSSDQRVRASTELAERNWIEITYELASELTEQELVPDNRLAPVLVRGVQVSRYQHNVQAFTNRRDEIWTLARTVSHWPLPMLQRPTVLLLSKAPTRVFVDAEVTDVQRN